MYIFQVFYFEPEVEENEDANESEGNSLNIFDGNKEVSNKEIMKIKGLSYRQRAIFNQHGEIIGEIESGSIVDHSRGSKRRRLLRIMIQN